MMKERLQSESGREEIRVLRKERRTKREKARVRD